MPTEVNRSAPNARPLDSRLFLRDEELDRGAALILSAERRLAAAVASEIKRADLSRSELDILIILHGQPGTTVSEVRDQLGLTVPTCARLLGRLDRRGLLDKNPTRKDARRRHLSLSDKAEILMQPILAALRDALRPAYRNAGAEHVSGARTILELIAGEGPDG